MTATSLDISSEAFRIYHYRDGATFRIDHPVSLHVKRDADGDTHRIAAADGQTYRPERGWVGISWEPRTGEPAFVA